MGSTDDRVGFWRKMALAIVPAIVSAGGISAMFNWGSAENARAEAMSTVVTEVGRVDAAIKKHLDEKFKPELTKMLDNMVDEHDQAMDELFEEIGRDIEECRGLANTADRNAYAALIGIGNRLGERRVVSALNEADRDRDQDAARAAAAEGPPDPPAHERRKHAKREFTPYEQQVQEPVSTD